MSGIVSLSVNASGAAKAAAQGDVVIIVDVIDMSTTMEAVIDEGAIAIFGASPVQCKAPVQLNPERIGKDAGLLAISHGTSVVIISEPRVGTDEERKARSAPVVRGIESSGAAIDGIFPNCGAETVKYGDFSGKVVVAVTDTGGVAFDAAHTAGAAKVLTGTVARTMKKRGSQPARDAAKRAISAARKLNADITVVASSANSPEDLLGAQEIMKMIIDEGFTRQ